MEAVKAKVDRASALRMAKMVAIGGALLGILYGYDNANAGAAQIFYGPDLGLSTAQAQTIVAAVPYGILAGCILGSIPTNYLGRKRTTGLVAIGYIIFCLAQASAWNFPSIIVARVLLGFVIGVSLIAVPVFIAESAATAKRGRALVGYQLAGVLGIILAFLVAMAVNGADDSYNWRIMFAVAAIPAIFLLPLILKLPETSRWLMMKGREAEAEEVLRMTEPDVDIEATMADMRAAIADEASGSLWQMFKRPFLRAAVFMMIMGLLIQLTGINAFTAYGVIILKDMGFDNVQSLGMNAAINFISFLAVIVAMLYVDRWGRKPIMIGGFGVMAIGLLMVAAAFWSAGGDGEGFNTWQKVLGIAGQTIGMAAFNFGVGGTVWAWASESLPSHLRSYGATILLAFDLLANIIVVQWFLTLGEAIGLATVWLIFAVIAVFGIIFVWFFAPETKGRDVDEVRLYWENGGKWPKEPIPAGANLNDLE